MHNVAKRKFPILILLAALILVSSSCWARGKYGGGFVPATPPVNVYTGSDRSYTGYGVLNFNVVLPLKGYPEFTLGGNEDAEYTWGDVEYRSNGIIYVDKAHLGNLESTESAWVFGKLDGVLLDNSFDKAGAHFILKHEQSGVFIGARNTTARRLTTWGESVVDYAYTSFWAFYNLNSHSRFATDATSSGTYIDDYDAHSFGVAWRPMVTLQPTFKLSSQFKVIPFIGAAAFVSAGLSSWTVNEWYDQLYGKDCLDGCPNSDFDFNLIPLESFAGFDLEYIFSDNSSLSLASFFSAGVNTDTSSMSETYLLYSKSFK